MDTTQQNHLQDQAWHRAAYGLNEQDMRLILEGLQAEVDASYRGDVDGERFVFDWKVYRIEAVHRYKTHEECGGDSYMGVYESVGVTDADRIDIVRIFDEDNKDYPALRKQLNDFNKSRH